MERFFGGRTDHSSTSSALDSGGNYHMSVQLRNLFTNQSNLSKDCQMFSEGAFGQHEHHFSTTTIFLIFIVPYPLSSDSNIGMITINSVLELSSHVSEFARLKRKNVSEDILDFFIILDICIPKE